MPPTIHQTILERGITMNIQELVSRLSYLKEEIEKIRDHSPITEDSRKRLKTSDQVVERGFWEYTEQIRAASHTDPWTEEHEIHLKGAKQSLQTAIDEIEYDLEQIELEI